MRDNPTYVILDLGCTRSMASRAAITAFAREAPRYGIRMKMVKCLTHFIFADSRKETVKESCIISFPTEPPCKTQVDILVCTDPALVAADEELRHQPEVGCQG